MSSDEHDRDPGRTANEHGAPRDEPLGRERLPARQPGPGAEIPPPPMQQHAERGWRVGKSFVAGLVLGVVLGAGITVLLLATIIIVGVGI